MAYEERDGYFAPAKVSNALSFPFRDDAGAFESRHYAFHVSDAEPDAIFGRIREAGLTYGSAPWSAGDGRLNDRGGRGASFKPPAGTCSS